MQLLAKTRCFAFRFCSSMNIDFTSRRVAATPPPSDDALLVKKPGHPLLHPISTSWRYSPTALEWCFFCLSFCLTPVGFFLETPPLIVACFPLLFAILVDQFRFKFWCLAGYFIWPTAISAWGLVQLGFDPFYVVPISVMMVFVISCMTAWGTVGLVGLFLSVVPFFPGSPFLIAGSILPGWGIWAYFVLVPLLIFIELHRERAARVVYLVLLCIFAVTLHFVNFKGQHLIVGTNAPNRIVYPAFQTVNITDLQSIKGSKYQEEIAARIPEHVTAILGEKILQHSDPIAWSNWCQIAQSKNATLLVSVQGEDSIGEVWKLDTQTCPNPARIYKAQIGVPSVTGGWTPNVPDWQVWRTANSDPQWLINFEAFSLVRWFGVGLSDAVHAPIISNDAWIEPLPIGVLHRKVGREFEKLYKIHTVYVETGRNFVFVQSRIR